MLEVVDESLYIWKILEAHAAACFYTGRREEAKSNFNEILEILSSPEWTTEQGVE
jgi:hypothetical protein